jgi:hypothetical protein
MLGLKRRRTACVTLALYDVALVAARAGVASPVAHRGSYVAQRQR